MENSLFTTQGKKLILLALFLLGVAQLVGGQDDPGVLAAAQQGGAIAPPEAPAFVPSAPPAPQAQARQEQPAPPPVQQVYVSGEALIDPATGYDPVPLVDTTPR